MNGAHGSGIWETNVKVLVPGKVSLLCLLIVKGKERGERQEIEPRVLHVSPPLGPASLGPTSQPPISPGPMSLRHCLPFLLPGAGGILVQSQAV